MTPTWVPTPQGLTELWEQRWPECLPFAHWLRSCYPDRWVRFHSLPESKRYASSEAEYSMILDRHYTVLSELDPGPDILVVTADWTETTATMPQMWPRRSEVAPGAWHWQTLLEDPEYRSYTQLYVQALPWLVGMIDGLLRAVADDELANVILAPTNLRWLYHPYDGGADVILATNAERDGLKARHIDWLSKHPKGL